MEAAREARGVHSSSISEEDLLVDVLLVERDTEEGNHVRALEQIRALTTLDERALGLMGAETFRAGTRSPRQRVGSSGAHLGLSNVECNSGGTEESSVNDEANKERMRQRTLITQGRAGPRRLYSGIERV